MTKEQKLNKFNYHYEFCERQKQREMYEEEIDRAEQLEQENKKLKKAFQIIYIYNVKINKVLQKNYEGYKYYCKCVMLVCPTKEEYEILKEVLNG